MRKLLTVKEQERRKLAQEATAEKEQALARRGLADSASVEAPSGGSIGRVTRGRVAVPPSLEVEGSIPGRLSANDLVVGSSFGEILGEGTAGSITRVNSDDLLQYDPPRTVISLPPASLSEAMANDMFTARIALERLEEWGRWTRVTPALTSKEEWAVLMLPPAGRAMLRFRVSLKDHPNLSDISVYLDVSDNLGSMGQPYWEAFPIGTPQGTARYLMADTEGLLKCLNDELTRRKEQG